MIGKKPWRPNWYAKLWEKINLKPREDDESWNYARSPHPWLITGVRLSSFVNHLHKCREQWDGSACGSRNVRRAGTTSRSLYLSPCSICFFPRALLWGLTQRLHWFVWITVDCDARTLPWRLLHWSIHFHICTRMKLSSQCTRLMQNQK